MDDYGDEARFAGPRPESVEVMLAQIQGQIKTLTQVVDLQISQAAKTALAAETKAADAHRRLDKEMAAALGPLREEIRQLQLWRERWIGVVAGASTIAGTAGGLTVAMLGWAIGGG